MATARARRRAVSLAPTESFLPPRLSLPALRAAAAHCRGCPLYLHATQTVFGAKFRVTRDRGKLLTHELAAKMIATLHPSAILRAPDERARAAGRKALVADLELAARHGDVTR